jgi:pteridine reductase
MAKNILITGGAKRLGAACARFLHAQGANTLIHFQHSRAEAEQVCEDLNRIRTNSASMVEGNLNDMADLGRIAQTAQDTWGGVDVLVNNASAFYPTPFANANETQWEELMGSNLKAPFFLAQKLSVNLSARKGCIVNMVDIHAERGLPEHAIYCIAKAGLVAMTKILAKELAPAVRVNAIAPGAILWPDAGLSSKEKSHILERVPLGETGNPEDIAKAMCYLIENADYMTGQILTVDGGRTLNH